MTQEIAAGTAVITSGGIAAVTWLTQVNEVAQLVATIIAIVAGSLAAWWHYEKAAKARKDRLGGSD